MASNSFGQYFKITTWGESHGPAMGVVIDGCPAGIPITEDEIGLALKKRAPGRHEWVSQRKESDQPIILSGVFEGCTTGTPVSILIQNQDSQSEVYLTNKNKLRPGHANYVYQEKYGNFDYRGGGRASARETVCRVAASVFAKKILSQVGIANFAYLVQVGSRRASVEDEGSESFQKKIQQSRLFCPDEQVEQLMQNELNELIEAGDSIGGKVRFYCSNVPPGLGDPIYEKLSANLAKALFSLPAVKAFELGEGVNCVNMKGSMHNDAFFKNGDKVQTQTNHAGGILAGISNGMPIIGEVSFKPASSIRIPQLSLDLNGEACIYETLKGSRHDPCVAIRAVPVVEAMCDLVLADAYLMRRLQGRIYD